MEKLSKEDENRIMSALESVVKLTNSGTTPDDAIYKIACENKFSAPVVQRMVEAYNISKTRAHMKQASGPARAETFPIADTVNILEKMYPPKEKAASALAPKEEISDEYSEEFNENFNRRRAELKVASIDEHKVVQPYGHDEKSQSRLLWNRKTGVEKRADIAREQAESAFWELHSLIKKAGQYFRNLYHTPFAEVETRLVSAYGDSAKTATAAIFAFNNLEKAGEKRAEAFKPGKLIVDAKAEPYSSFLKVYEAAEKFNDLNEKAAEAYCSMLEFMNKHGFKLSAVENPNGYSVEEPIKEASLLDGIYEEKQAAPFPGIEDVRSGLADAAQTGMQTIGLAPKDPSSVKDKALREVMDPVHETKINAIKTKAVLNDLISNDPILSSYDPHQVLHAYNQLQELSPSTGQQPTILRGLLRRIIQQEGVIEPHEAQQITAIERSLRGQPTLQLFENK